MFTRCWLWIGRLLRRILLITLSGGLAGGAIGYLYYSLMFSGPVSSEEQIPKGDLQHKPFHICNISTEFDFLDWIISPFLVKKGQHTSRRFNSLSRNFDAYSSSHMRFRRDPSAE